MKNRLKVLRAERDWTQAQLAAELEVSRQTVNAIEKGKFDHDRRRNPPLSLVAHLQSKPALEKFALLPRAGFRIRPRFLYAPLHARHGVCREARI